MKNLLAMIFVFFSAIVVFHQPISAQNRFLTEDEQKGNSLNYVRVDFLLDPLLPLPEIGFDNPQSNWKIEYELFLTETSELEKMGRCHRDEQQRFICPLLIEKKEKKNFREKIKSKSVEIYQGSFERNNLVEESNRNFFMLIPLNPKITKILDDSKKSEGNPAFVLFFKTKFNLKNSRNQKFIETREGDAELPLKAIIQDKKYITFELNRKEITVGYGITKSDGGRIMSIPYGH